MGYVPNRCGLVAAWSRAVLAGSASPDDAAEAVRGRDLLHRVVGLPGLPEPVSWAVAFSRLQGLGVRDVRLVLPVPGDPGALPGPAAVNAAALAAGEAVLLTAAAPALVVPTPSAPTRPGDAVRWDWLPCGPPRPAGHSLADADRELRTALHDAVATLSRLDLARSRERVPELLDQAERRAADQRLPRSFPSAARAVLRQAARLEAIVRLARADDGAAVTGGEAAARSEALAPLADAARRAVEAAYSAGPEDAAARTIPGR